MTLLQKIGYIIVILCFWVWLYLLFNGESNTASNITGATSFLSLLLSVFNPFDRKTKGTGRRDDYNWNGYSDDEYTKEAFRSIALGLALVLFIAALGLAVYPKIQSLMETKNIPDSTLPNNSAIPYDSLEFRGHHYYILQEQKKAGMKQ